LIHDLLPKLIETRGAGSGESALNIGGFDFASGLRWSWSGVGSFKPKRVRIEREQPRLLSGGVTELEAKFNSRNLR
jgi:hypothetical protein